MATSTGRRSRIAFVAVALVVLGGGSNNNSNSNNVHSNSNRNGLVAVEAFVSPSSPLTHTLLPNLWQQHHEGREEQTHSGTSMSTPTSTPSASASARSMFPLRSFKFIKGESSYGDLVDGAINGGALLGGAHTGGRGSLSMSAAFGGESAAVGTNSFRSNRRAGRPHTRTHTRTQIPSWWSAKSGFSRSTSTTLLAAGSVESWPVLEADDIQILVRKGDAMDDDIDDDDDDDDEYSYQYQYQEYDDYGNPIPSSSHSPSSTNKKQQQRSSVRATLERWERDISLRVVGRDGYPMLLGSEPQPTWNTNTNTNDYYDDDRSNHDDRSDRCTQKIEFHVANGDLYPFSGTVSVPPPLTIEDSKGNQQSVMMVLNNPEDHGDDDDDDEYEYGNPLGGSSLVMQQQQRQRQQKKRRSKGKTLEAKIEPLYKSPDEKYAEAQQQQQHQYNTNHYQDEHEHEYDEFGNELYNANSNANGKTTIPSQGYQSFQLDATDPASGKIKISLERDQDDSTSRHNGGGGLGGAFRSVMNTNTNTNHNTNTNTGTTDFSSEARVEIYHGFRDQHGNYHSHDPEEEDKRISLDVSTMHPTFSSVVDTMPSELLAKHTKSSSSSSSSSQQQQRHAQQQPQPQRSYQPYLEVRIVNTGGAALKAGVQSYMPYYKAQNEKERRRRQQQGTRVGTNSNTNPQRLTAMSLPPMASSAMPLSAAMSNRNRQSRTAAKVAAPIKADDPFLLVDSARSSTSSRRIRNNGVGNAQRETSYVAASGNNGVNNNYRRSATRMQGFGGNSNRFMGTTTTTTSGVTADVPGGSDSFAASKEARKLATPRDGNINRYDNDNDDGNELMGRSGLALYNYYNGPDYNSRNEYNGPYAPQQQQQQRRYRSSPSPLQRNNANSYFSSSFIDVDGNAYNRYGMGISLCDRIPEYPLSPDYDTERRPGSGRTIDTVATTPGGHSSSNTNHKRPTLASFGGNGGTISGMQSLQGRHQQLREQERRGQGARQQLQLPPQVGRSTGNLALAGGKGTHNRLPGNAGSFGGGTGNGRKYNNNNQAARGAFAGNGRIIGDGIIKGQRAASGFSGFSSSGGLSSGNDNGNNGFGGNGNRYGNENRNGYSSNNINNSNRMDETTTTTTATNGPFGNMGRPPQTTGNRNNPFATLNGETTSSNDYDNDNDFTNSNNNGFDNNFDNYESYDDDDDDDNYYSDNTNDDYDTDSFAGSSNFNQQRGNSFSSNTNSNSFAGSSNFNQQRGNSFSSDTKNSNSFAGSSNFNGNKNSNSFAGGMGSPQQSPQPNMVGRSSATKNPFGGINGNSNGNANSQKSGGPFGNIGGNSNMNNNNNNFGNNRQNSSPFGSIGNSPTTTAMSSRNDNNFVEYEYDDVGNYDSDYEDAYEYQEEETERAENPIMGFAKNFVKGMTGS